MKVLLVDPDETRRAAVSQALRAGGLDVSEAPSGSFALTMLEWNRHDVILSRSRIDDMEGLELCGILRADPATRALRFVLMMEAHEGTPSDTGGVDLVLTDGTAGAAVLPMVVQLMRRDPGQSVTVELPAPRAPSSTVSSPAPPTAGAARPVTAGGPPAGAPPVAAAMVVTPPTAVSPAPIGGPPVAPPPVVEAPPVAVRSAPTGPMPRVESPASPPSAPRTPGARPATAAVEIPARAFQGSLGVLEMEELVQAIALGQKTGRLLIVLAGGGGMVAFDTGSVIHAEFDTHSGSEAFQALVTSAHREGTGKFCFIPGDAATLANLPRTISATTEQLMLTIAAAMDESKG